MISSTTLTTATIAAPVPHDFPFPTFRVCRFPIPPGDLAGGEYEPWHASTCADGNGDRDGELGADGPDGLGEPAAQGTTGWAA